MRLPRTHYRATPGMPNRSCAGSVGATCCAALAAWIAGSSGTLATVGQAHRTVTASANLVAGTSGKPVRQDMRRVIVTLKNLEAGPAWAAKISSARERVLEAIGGHQFEINRTYDLIPALALSVDVQALRILQQHPDVASVADDGGMTPGDAKGSTK